MSEKMSREQAAANLQIMKGLLEIKGAYLGLSDDNGMGNVMQTCDLAIDALATAQYNERAFETITAKVQNWSYSRGLNHTDPARQMLKLTEEVGELAAAIVRNNKSEIIDAVGDVIVVLTILCQQFDISTTGCFWEAYQTIKDRTGKTVNGIYVKSDDLEEDASDE